MGNLSQVFLAFYTVKRFFFCVHEEECPVTNWTVVVFLAVCLNVKGWWHVSVQIFACAQEIW